MSTVSIGNLDKAALLKALHDASKAPEEERQFCPMSEAMAKRFIEGGQTRFDFVNRRSLKFDLGASEFDTSAYDEANGAGLAERVIAELRGPVAEAPPDPESAAETEPEVAPVASELEDDGEETDPSVAETLPAPEPEEKATEAEAD